MTTQNNNQSANIIIADATNENRNSVHMRWTNPDGSEGWVDGEIYYNRDLERYEETTEFKGVEYLVVSKA